MKKYGDAANLPTGALKKRGGGSSSASSRGASPSPAGGGSRAAGARGGVKGDDSSSGSTRGASVPSPLVGESLPPTGSGGQGGGSTSRAGSKVHKPHLDEMHGPESLPHRPNRAPRKPSPDDTGTGSGSKIFQPTDSRQSGPEFGPAPRSSGGAPGHRGGWKKR